MKTTRIALLALVLTGSLAGAGSAATTVSAGIHVGPSGRATVDIGFFYDDLAPYGNWVQRPSYGWVWRPHAVASTWRPYQHGHWAWTDYGWTWISDEPYGWATYHYGRWYDDPDYGWEWVPGDEWGPAWVDWQAGDDYVGWAPLPPAYDVYRPSRYAGYLQPDDYVFVPETRFLAVNVFSYAAPRRDCGRIYHRTRNFTSYRRFNNGYFNQGVPVNRFERRGISVPRYQVADMQATQRHRGSRIAQNRVEVFRPRVQRSRVAPPPSRPIARRSVVNAPQMRQDRRVQRDQRDQRDQHIGRQTRQGRDIRPQMRQDRQIQRDQVRQQTRQGRDIRQQVRQDRQVQRGQIRQQGRQGRDVRQQMRQDRQIQRQQQIRQQERPNRQQMRQGRQVQRQQIRQEERPNRQQMRQGRQVQRQQQIRQQERPNRQQQMRQGRQAQRQQIRQQERPNRQQGRQQGGGGNRQQKQQHGNGRHGHGGQ